MILLKLQHVDAARVVQRRARAPDLKDVVFGRGGEGPVLVRAPREVRRPARVAAVGEEQLGRAVLLVVGRLLHADLGDVPDVDAAVARGRGEDGLVVGRPGELEDLF